MTPRILIHLLAGGAFAVSSASLSLSAQNFTGGTHGVNGATTVETHSGLTPWRESRTEKHLVLEIRDGAYTVDGFTGKVQLNYNIHDPEFLYFFMPGEGTAVVSLKPLPDAVLVKHGLEGSHLAFNAGGHDFRLDSAVPLLPNSTKEIKGGRDAKLDLYVRFDREANHLARAPLFGFGTTTQAPYNWPASMPQQQMANDVPVRRDAPPLPASVLPRVQQVSLAAVSH